MPWVGATGRRVEPRKDFCARADVMAAAECISESLFVRWSRAGWLDTLLVLAGCQDRARLASVAACRAVIGWPRVRSRFGAFHAVDNLRRL